MRQHIRLTSSRISISLLAALAILLLTAGCATEPPKVPWSAAPPKVKAAAPVAASASTATAPAPAAVAAGTPATAPKAAAATATAAAEAPAAGPAAPTEDLYVIGQADEIEVQVWQEPDLSRSAVVRADGMVSLPLVNDIKAEGATVKQLRDLLTAKFKEVVSDPVVSVMISRPMSATFYITGKVARPGEYPLFKETTILQALAVAGGFTEWAKTGKLAIIRKGGEKISADYDAIISGNASKNITLKRGDTIVVP
jgi:polysaccharide export outer membrane protein